MKLESEKKKEKNNNNHWETYLADHLLLIFEVKIFC